jgi:hypothetical protein
MRIDNKFLAKLLGVNESEIKSISGLSFKTDVPDRLVIFQSLLDERRKKRFESLSAALSTEDDLGKVVRAHIHIEHELQELIFLAAPRPDHIKRFENMEFFEKVQLALVLGLNADLKPALSATGTLRNKFAHRLDMKIGEEEAKNLIATLTPRAKQRFQAHLNDALSAIPSSAALAGEALSYFNAQIKVSVFFLQLFDQVAEERHRLAFEKIQLYGLTLSAEGIRNNEKQSHR